MTGGPELRSAIEPVVWPAVLRGEAAQLLALQGQFEATQWWPEARLRQYQFGQLQRLVEHAARAVPFYAERLRLAGIDPQAPLTEAAWARLPVLTRHEVQDAGEQLQASALPPQYGGTGITTTGGSTGIPVRVRKSALDLLFWSAVAIREELWHREDMRGTIARVRALPGNLTPEQIARVRSPEGLILPNWGPPASQVWHTGPAVMLDYTLSVPDQAAYLGRLGPDYLFTDPSNLRLLLAHCRDEGIALPSLRAVWTVSEVVDPALRALCAAVFGVRIVHNFSAAEVGYIALQCPEHEHFHVQSEVVHVEVLDAQGRACGPGEIGRVVVTPLHNFAMPLLRYELGDEAEMGVACPCGRGLPVLTQVIGRTIDHLTLPSGQKRRPVLNHYRLAEFTAIREFQIVQRSVTRIEVLMVVGRPLTSAEEVEVKAVLTAELGEEFAIELRYCEALPRTAAGKLRPFVSDL
jgi:phenylacetate-CoA ligase